MSNRYISIDVATKSMAVSIIDYNNEGLDLTDKESFKNLKIIRTYTENLAPNRSNSSIDEIERVTLVNNFFKDNLLQYVTENTIILLEKQIATTPSYICYITLISSAINKKLNVKIIAATRKNQLAIDDEKIGKYFKICQNSYKANKEHSKALVDLIRPYLSNTENIVIDKKMITDWSDTVSQLVAFIINI